MYVRVYVCACARAMTRQLVLLSSAPYRVSLYVCISIVARSHVANLLMVESKFCFLFPCFFLHFSPFFFFKQALKGSCLSFFFFSEKRMVTSRNEKMSLFSLFSSHNFLLEIHQLSIPIWWALFFVCITEPCAILLLRTDFICCFLLFRSVTRAQRLETGKILLFFLL